MCYTAREIRVGRKDAGHRSRSVLLRLRLNADREWTRCTEDRWQATDDDGIAVDGGVDAVDS